MKESSSLFVFSPMFSVEKNTGKEMKLSFPLILLLLLICLGCNKKSGEQQRTVLAIPVYGQSLALGEEAVRVTDFDSLSKKTLNHVVTENLDGEFGYLSDTHFKQRMKKILGDKRRAFELSIYGMSEVVAAYLQKKGALDSIMICTFPGGQGATSIVDLGRGSKPYVKFLDEIKKAHNKAREKGWKFIVPAFCWMQGENDIVWKKSTNYKKDLKMFQLNLSEDIKAITGQPQDVACISYQTNCLTLSKSFNEATFNAKEVFVPQGQLELIQEDSLFFGSGPTYPYSFVDERVHLDGISQKRLGYMAGLSVVRMLESKPIGGLFPRNTTISGDTVLIDFAVPHSPLVLDTVAVLKAANYGFSVVSPKNVNILRNVLLKDNTIKLFCKRSPAGCKVRYAVNGLRGKNGYKHGPRGNLRDSQGNELKMKILNKVYPLHNWCYQFSYQL
ncbi:sialate O-acetylesterase [Desertivirga xinjiangensis]|uniref:sialate O-acetylesterase n=1 Tax=Desertivirga xinjiangensis TaxID=539206 RepID=UPI002108B948|nr:sialate O-acetylesterase [Pedobacter xinjiangensis]